MGSFRLFAVSVSAFAMMLSLPSWAMGKHQPEPSFHELEKKYGTAQTPDDVDRFAGGYVGTCFAKDQQNNGEVEFRGPLQTMLFFGAFIESNGQRTLYPANWMKTQ